MSRERSIESRIAEHRRFREQCRRRIRPALVISIFSSAAVDVWAFFRPVNWWIVSGLLLFAWGQTLMEVQGYYRHGRNLRRLTDEKSA